MKATVADALARLPLPATEKWLLGVWDTNVIRHGTMSVSIFAPRGTDFQTPHSQDELYFIISGTGEFMMDGETTTFAPGDVLFVAAHVPHRFIEFSPDFVCWVVFYGPEGGEVPASTE